MTIDVKPYSKEYEQRMVEMILDIQQNEFKVPVTIDDQPDLLAIDKWYRSGKGNFWIATDGDKLVGTIALIDIGNHQSALRKMFVHKDYRGKDKAIGQLLLDTLINSCRENDIREIYLGTIERMLAAHRFYRKNGFEEIAKKDLPASFPLMPVDNMFFGITLNQSKNESK